MTVTSMTLSNRQKIGELLERTTPRLYEKHFLPTYIKLLDIRCRGRVKRAIEDRIAQKPFALFTEIEIETLNRCNNDCSFCPVNRKHDPRPLSIMDEDLFNSLIAQLADLHYEGEISLFSNNEPLLDRRIADFCKIAKQKLPNAHHFLFTNGKLLTPEVFENLMKSLDGLVIDNYDNEMKLQEPVKAISELCLTNPTYREKVEIYMRKKDETLSTRGGNAPNRSNIAPLKSSCILPFIQMVVRPDGKISLCCNDALGKVTLGDLTRDSISDVWNSDLYWGVRRRIVEGRKNFFLCRSCDAQMCRDNASIIRL
jgi:MoaA/NifB/PqqE/SkfB family radical SAM enzyme